MSRVNDNFLLGLDIGTDSVKAIIAEKNKSNVLEIVGVGRVEQVSGAMNAGAIMNISAVTDSCERAIHEAESMAGSGVRSVVVGIAGELVKCSTSRIHYQRKNGDRPLSDSEMTVLLEKVQNSAREKAREEIAFETDNPHAEVSLINSAIVSVMIDGQKANNPIGFRGEDVVLEFYTAFAPKVYVRSIEKVCADLNLDLLAIAVDPFAICRACLGENNSADSPAIVIDIGGGNTSIAVVDGDGIRGTETFSMGARSAEKDLSVWLSGVEIALADFPHVSSFPCRIFLCGGGSADLDIQEALAVSDWYKNLPFSRRPVIGLIEVSDLVDIENKTTTEINSAYITAIGLARVALDVVGSEKNSRLTSRISRFLKN